MARKKITFLDDEIRFVHVLEFQKYFSEAQYILFRSFGAALF